MEGSIQTAKEEKDRLEKSYKELWTIFSDVDIDKNSFRAWVDFFDKGNDEDSIKARKNFYEKLSSFSKMMTLAVSSYSLYQMTGSDIMSQYKSSFAFFQKLRAELIEYLSGESYFS